MPAPLTVVTWNVLHRVHAENWAEEVPERHPDEAARLAALTERLAALAAEGALLALQEVSGDLLDGLRAAAPGAQLFSLRYPRVPRPRPGTRHRVALRDPSEHLVVLVAADLPARPVAAAAFDDDPGKGLVAVEVAGVVVVAAHVTHGERRVGQLRRLRAVAGARGGAALLLGDFNADRAAIQAALGDDLRFACPADPARPTRPRVGGDKPQDIDHIILAGACPLAVVDAQVLDARGLSDHNPVRARLLPAP